MKNWSLLFLSFLLTNLLTAQADIAERQIGFDATAFITRFLSFNPASSGTSNPEILFLYRKEKDGKHLRYGVGGRFDLTKRKEGSSEIRNLAVRLDFKFGREYHKDISKKWRTYIGWDALIGAFENNSKSTNTTFGNPGNDSVTSYNRGGNIRVNPLVGIQFFLNKRFSLSTEMAYGLDIQASFNSNARKTFTIETFYAPPISIVLNYKI